MTIINKLKKKIRRIEKKIVKIQEECCHPKDALEKVGNSNTGNYDPSQDSYWYDCHCKLCDKKWREEQ